MRHVLLVLALGVCGAGCAAAQPAAGPPSPQARAAAVSAALLARGRELPDRVAVDACTVAQALGDGDAALRLLDERVRPLVQGSPGDCPRGAYAPGSGPWWEVLSVEQTGPDRLLLRARWLAPFSRERTEDYLLARGPGGELRVTEIRLTPGIEKDTQPIIP